MEIMKLIPTGKDYLWGAPDSEKNTESKSI